MEPKRILFSLLFLTCIQLGAVIAAFRNSQQREQIVADSAHPHIPRKLYGRHRLRRPPIVTLYGNNAEKSRGQEVKKLERSTKTGVSTPQDIKVATTAAPPQATTKPVIKDVSNNGSKSDGGGPFGKLPVPSMVDTKTAFFILVGVTVLVIGCFVFRLIRSRARRKTKKYGILATRGSEVELTPLDQEEEDEDMTVFDANSK